MGVRLTLGVAKGFEESSHPAIASRRCFAFASTEYLGTALTIISPKTDLIVELFESSHTRCDDLA